MPACDEHPGRTVPVVDRNRCEAKGDCVDVCPYDVFTILAVPKDDRRELSLLGRLKLVAHGGKQAYVTSPGACHACSECVRSCPEDAIKLTAARV